MQVSSSFRRRRISLTSLIDVIFLLLLFFMLSSTFSKFSDIELAVSGGGAFQSGDQRFAFLKLGDKTLRLNGNAVDLQTLGTSLKDMQQNTDINALVVSVSAEASSQHLVDTLTILRSASGLSFQFIR